MDGMAVEVKRRRRRSVGSWRALLRRFEGSGLSVVDFCRREEISPASFHRWRGLLGQVKPARQTAVTSGPGFIDLGVVSESAGTGSSTSSRLELKLDLGGGVVLHLVRG